MATRTFAFGDIHGDLSALLRLLERLPTLSADDTLVFLGDYLDRGPDSAGVVELLARDLPRRGPARVVCLLGNHEDAWLRVLREDGWPAFTGVPTNGCRACAESFLRGQPRPMDGAGLGRVVHTGAFFPGWATAWLEALPAWYEDEHGIYVHAGLPREDGRWLHPSEVADRQRLLWDRDRDFFTGYDGKPAVCGHTVTRTLPQELSRYTEQDPSDLFWAGRSAFLIDTGAGKPGGFLTALELPARRVWESR
jgi:serine/threonine protein phosphatase 1